MFEQGDLGQCLETWRSTLKCPKNDPRAPGVGSRPVREPDWRFQPARHQAVECIIFEKSLYEYILGLYETAFERLDYQNQVEEAVFVLAELLQDSERAVSYLERKDRLVEAAELGRITKPFTGTDHSSMVYCREN